MKNKVNYMGSETGNQQYFIFKSKLIVCFWSVPKYTKRMPKTLYNTSVYPKVSGLAAWSENFKWYSSLPLRAVVSLFCVLV